MSQSDWGSLIVKQHSFRIGSSLQLEQPKFKIEAVVSILEVMYNLPGNVNAVHSLRTRRHIIHFYLLLYGMVQNHFLLVPFTFFPWPKVFCHNPSRTIRFVSLDTPEYFSSNLRPPKRVRENFPRSLNPLAEIDVVSVASRHLFVVIRKEVHLVNELTSSKFHH
jgi:hypothetical protein